MSRGEGRPRFTAPLAALLAALLTVPVQAGAAQAIELADAEGDTLVLDAPARRIVTLAPHLAELVYLAGAGDRLLATVAYSDHPPAAEALPRIGDAFRFDLERLLALDPDLVIAWDSGNPDAALATMDQLGLPVWRTKIDSIPAMATLLRDLGRATALDTSAAADAVEDRWEALQARHADQAPVRYFYQVAERPLYTVNGEHLISAGLGACGGVNVFADLPTLAPQISAEAVIQADPEVLFAGRADDAEDPLAHWRAWPRMAAVRDEALFTLPSDLINRATPRMLDAIDEACTLLEGHRDRAKASG